MDWGGLATAAWKKGGALACGAGGAAGVVHSATGRDAGAGDAVQPLSAPWGGDGGGDGATCRCTDGAARGGARGRRDTRHPPIGFGRAARAGGAGWGGGEGRGLVPAAAPPAGGAGRRGPASDGA